MTCIPQVVILANGAVAMEMIGGANYRLLAFLYAIMRGRGRQRNSVSDLSLTIAGSVDIIR
ncbi:hypothetical protein LXJ15735_06810 [Lacrimispora xylanolytica]